MRRGRPIVAVTVGVIVLAGAATWLVAFRDTADPVTVDEAVMSFRTDTEPAASRPSPQLRVEGVDVRTVHVRKATTFSGAVRGMSRHDIWFDLDSGLPAKVVMVSHTTNDSPIGDVFYEETVTLRLTSLEPRR